MDRQSSAQFAHRGDDHLIDLEEKLERMTPEIPYAAIDDLPMRYKRHTKGVPGRFSLLLHRLAWAIMCYHEHH